MFKTEIPINRRDFISLNMYYLKKYFGVREILLLLFLFVAGLVLGFWMGQLLILILCAVTLAIMIGAIVFYYATSCVGYKMEFAKRGATRWQISIDQLGFVIDLYEKGDQKYTEKRLFAELERVALLKDRAYLYFGAALMYYIRFDNFTEGNFVEFCEFIKQHVEPSRFKMKQKKNKNRGYTKP